MTAFQATACAHPNIAFIKYWGNRDDRLRLPANGSISMNLDTLVTRTSVAFQGDLTADQANVNGQVMTGSGLERITQHLDHVRQMAGVNERAVVTSSSNYPTGAGIASSAAAFAALSLAAAAALDLQLSERELSCLARLGSGSACRSIPAGFVEWHAAETHEASYAETIAPADYWSLVDLVAIVSQAHKSTGSTEGHALAGTSPLQNARVQAAPGRIAQCKQAILARDFEQLAEVVEHDSNMMHAVMMTGNPPLLYWLPETVAIMQRVRQMRLQGVEVLYTIDAGPNVHCLCTPGSAAAVKAQLSALPGVLEIREAMPGGAAYLEA